MPANYPNANPSFTPIVASVDYPQAADLNVVYDEVTAIGTALRDTGLEHNLFPESTGDARTLGTSSKLWGQSYLKGLTLGASTELTIAAGVVTATPGVFRVDTEADAAADDLDTITAGSGVIESSIVILRAENVARVVTVKHGTGNILLAGAVDFVMNTTGRLLLLLYDGTNWRQLGPSANLASANTVFAGPTSGGAAAPTFRALVAGDITTSGLVSLLDADVTATTVTNTTTETTVYSYAVSGGVLGSTKALRLTLIGHWVNATGGGESFTVRVKYGATTVFSYTYSPSNGTYPFHLKADLSALNATNAQVAETIFTPMSAAGALAGAGAAASPAIGLHTTVAEDSTASKNLVVTFQMATASASLTLVAHAVRTELIG